jgi:hypothetical protein
MRNWRQAVKSSDGSRAFRAARFPSNRMHRYGPRRLLAPTPLLPYAFLQLDAEVNELRYALLKIVLNAARFRHILEQDHSTNDMPV